MYLTDDLVLVDGTEKDVKIVQAMQNRISGSYASLLGATAVTAVFVTPLSVMGHLTTMDLAAQGRGNAAVWLSYTIAMVVVTYVWTYGIYTAYRLVRYELPYRQLVREGNIIDLGANTPRRELIVTMLHGSETYASLWLAECGREHVKELHNFVVNKRVRELALGLSLANTDQLRLSITSAAIRLLPPALQPSFAAHAAHAKDMAWELSRNMAKQDAATERRLGIG